MESGLRDEQIVELAGLLAGEAQSLQMATELLERNGWVLLKLGPPLLSLLPDASKFLHFFTTTAEEAKLNYTEYLGSNKVLDGAVYGYNKQENFKEGLRLLTGGRLKSQWLPSQCSKELENYVHSLDQTMLELLKVFSGPLFRHSPELGKVPLLVGSPQSFSDMKVDNFAMLDIVYYSRHNPNSTSDVSVAEHIDPGLLSLNILSTQPGLQFRNSSGKWIDVPLDYGVLWTGELAYNISEHKVKPGIHRVVSDGYLEKKTFTPRLSIWIEACTASQDFTFSKNHIVNTPEVVGVNIQVSGTNQKRASEEFPLTALILNKGESLESALLRGSRAAGVPLSKIKVRSQRIVCPFCMKPYGDNLLKHFTSLHEDIPVIQKD